MAGGVGVPAAPATAAGGRLRSAVLVGRDAELARAVAVVATPPAVVVIEGESGIGKTRLVSELRQHPDLAGRRLVAGGCHRIREPFPLGPVLEAARGLGDAPEPESLSPVAGALRPLLPEIAERLPAPLPPLGDRLADRHRVFRGLVALLDAAGSAVLVLEDLHWADEQTVEFLGYLLAGPPPGLSLVLTYRGEEVAPAVRALTARIPDRLRQAHVMMAPLDAGQTGALAAAILDTDRVSGEFAGYLCERASGLPLAIEELLALLRARGALVPHGKGWARRTLDQLEVPRGIRDPVLERAGRLSPAGRSVLDAAAVLQLPAEPPVLIATADLPPAQTDAGLAEPLDTGLLSWQDGRVGFRHVLAMQAVYEDIPPPQRQQWHARAAAALTGLNPAPLGQLAHHLRHAGDGGAWVDAAERAADQAAELGDHDQAALLLEDVLRHAPLPDAHRGRLTVKLGWAAAETVRPQDGHAGELFALALERAPDLPASMRGELRFLWALLLARTGGDPEGRRDALAAAVRDLDGLPELKAFAMIGLATPRAAGLPPVDYAAWLERVTQTLAEIDDPSSRLLGKVAMLLSSTGDPRWRAVASEIRHRAGNLPRHVGDVNALTSAASGACYAGHHRTAEALLTTAMAGAKGLESPIEVIKCRAVELLLSFCRGAWEGLAEQGAQLLDELHDDYVYLRGHARVMLAGLAVARGETGDATAWLRDLVGSPDTAAELDVLPFAVAGFTRLELARDNVAAVLPVVTGAIAAWEAYPLLPPAMRALPGAAQAMLAAGEAQQAEALVRRWAKLVRERDAPLAPAALEQARGSLAAAAGRWNRAAERHAAAARRYRDLLCPYEAAQSDEQAADCWIRVGDARARPALLAAIAGYRQLGATWDLDRAGGLARRHGVPVPARHRGGRRGYGTDLSPREREVAELVATGRTNREIARDLYLSTKTVDKHISAALRKLALPSRAALAHHIGTGGPPAGTNDGESPP